MTASSLTIVGGSARAAAQSAVRAGFSPFAGDLFGDEDLRQLCPTSRVENYPAGLLDVCAGPQSGSWIYTGALENHPKLITRLTNTRPLLGNGADVVRRVRDPFLLAAALDRDGFSTLALRRTAEGLPRDGTWLRKPFRSAGGAEIARWDETILAAPDAPNFYFQQYVEGDVCGAVYVGNGTEARMLGVTRQLPEASGSFLYQGSIGPIEFLPSVRCELERLGYALAEIFQLIGLFGVDVIVHGDSFWPLEVNPRYTASVETLERSLGIQAMTHHVAGCERQALPTIDVPATMLTAAKQVLYSPRELIVPVELSSFVAHENKAAWPGYADIPAAGTKIRAGWPILTVLTAGENEVVARKRLQQSAEMVGKLLGLACTDNQGSRD